jgi:pre-mRNA-splicing factor CDC5/CEF1
MRIRDQFGLNEGLGEGLEGASLRAQKAAAAALRSDLRAGLAGLPAPENEYSVALPELLDEEVEAAVEEDAADVKARKAREAEAARQAEERKKTQVGAAG